MEVGEVQGCLEFAESGAVFFRVEFDGGVEGRGSVEVIPSIVEHAFDSIVTLCDGEIERCSSPLSIRDAAAPALDPGERRRSGSAGCSNSFGIGDSA
ncbi:hypothetical protein OHA70_38960 [Kribbella sp. NBC_00382]|uniref:hypothetical protein n=1 Tax=Kribbella sp. NBC_00382 TaxID=2975967 RepID=UPI002E1B2A65